MHCPALYTSHANRHANQQGCEKQCTKAVSCCGNYEVPRGVHWLRKECNRSHRRVFTLRASAEAPPLLEPMSIQFEEQDLSIFGASPPVNHSAFPAKFFNRSKLGYRYEALQSENHIRLLHFDPLDGYRIIQVSPLFYIRI